MATCRRRRDFRKCAARAAADQRRDARGDRADAGLRLHRRRGGAAAHHGGRRDAGRHALCLPGRRARPRRECPPHQILLRRSSTPSLQPEPGARQRRRIGQPVAACKRRRAVRGDDAALRPGLPDARASRAPPRRQAADRGRHRRAPRARRSCRRPVSGLQDRRFAHLAMRARARGRKPGPSSIAAPWAGR